MGSMKAKSGGTHRYSPVSCPHPIAMECWAQGRGAGSDGSSVWAELLLPMLSVLLRAAVVTGASSDLPHHAPAALCSCAGTEKEGERGCPANTGLLLGLNMCECDEKSFHTWNCVCRLL